MRRALQAQAQGQGGDDAITSAAAAQYFEDIVETQKAQVGHWWAIGIVLTKKE